ncbi:MFS general substrate transporter [Neoconidiobolus thromboides FSU 785]|nr:MFS general substrate transporter [Neoconidiobolus thromboides FSU 785]
MATSPQSSNKASLVDLETQTNQGLINNEATAIKDTEIKDRTFLKFIHLQGNVSILNFITYLICVFFSICFIVFINQIQAFLFAFKYKETAGLGELSATFTLWDEIVSIIMVIVWGLVSDRIGRRITFSLGFLIVGLALFFYTLPSRVLPDLLIVRLFFAIGASAITSMVAAGLADTVGHKNGMTSGIVGMFSGLGAVVSVFVLVPLPASLEKRTGSQTQSVIVTLYIVGAIAIVWSIINFFTFPKNNNRAIDVNGNTLTMKEEFIHGINKLPRACKLFFTDLRIAMAYISGFVARGDTIILTVFISAWVVKLFINENKCFISDDGDLTDPAIVKEQCRSAYSLAMMLSGIAQVFALIGAPIVGILLTKIKASMVLSLSSLLGAVGYFGFGFISSPYNKIVYLFICLLGVGEIGTIVTSLSFLSAHDTVEPELRGTVSGLYSFFGGLGIIICSKLGGYLFDHWRPGAPFIIMGIFHAILFVMGLVCFFIEKRKEKITSIQSNID